MNMLQATIIYASLTGNTEKIVERVIELLEEQAVDVTLSDCEAYEGTEFIHTDICTVGTYKANYQRKSFLCMNR